MDLQILRPYANTYNILRCIIDDFITGPCVGRRPMMHHVVHEGLESFMGGYVGYAEIC